MSKLSDTIDARLKELGIPGSKMCDDLGMSRSTLTELRKGRATTLKAEKAAAIASYLGMTVETLLGTEKEKTPTSTGGRSDSTSTGSKTEKDLLILARHLEKIPDDVRATLLKNFSDSIDIYLDAKGIPKEDES